ncbi:MAG: class I SAM-dependent methyltransferase [Alphaproteobacteria bacterium]|nr:class I SAM-dependent methyltransferase [Alphaproteobacteria bacterium]
MKTSDKLLDQYSGYYDEDSLSSKRALAASQTVEHILRIGPKHVENLLDVGAGEGAVLSELWRIDYARSLHAAEISDSGIAAIEKRRIPNLRSVQHFDGYHINASDDYYEFGTAIHVLEHVEHERAFLNEIARVCRTFYIEVPLELTLRLGNTLVASGRYGHINFYNPITFRNLLETSGLEVVSFRVFSNSLDYERYVSGRFKGAIKFAIRGGLLFMLPKYAPLFMTYLAGVVVRRKRT